MTSNAAPRPPRTPAEGVLCVDKPKGWTSRDVVNKVAGLVGDRGAGHAGTLDPDATGVLLIAFGEATKAVRWLMDAPKTYEAGIAFGAATLTDDAAGPVVREGALPHPLTEEALRAALTARLGRTLQVPPAVSALQKDGVRDHERVRRGETVTREAREVLLYGFEVREVGEASARVRVTCGAGFYVRALARDLGQDLGGAAHLSDLRRLSAGGFDVAECVGIAELAELAAESRRDRLVPLATCLPRLLPTLAVDRDTARMLVQGKKPALPPHLSLAPGAEALVVLDEDGGLVCVATAVDPPEDGRRRLETVRGFTAAQRLVARETAADSSAVQVAPDAGPG